MSLEGGLAYSFGVVVLLSFETIAIAIPQDEGRCDFFLFARKNAFKTSEHSSHCSPEETSGLWWHVGCSKKQAPCSTAPPFGSAVPKCSLAILANEMAPAHMAQGSRVT